MQPNVSSTESKPKTPGFHHARSVTIALSVAFSWTPEAFGIPVGYAKLALFAFAAIAVLDQ
jgi:hypothetical protein